MPRPNQPTSQPVSFWLISILLLVIIGYFTFGYMYYTFFGSSLDLGERVAATITTTPFVAALGGIATSMTLFVRKKHALAWRILMFEIIIILLFIAYSILITWRS